MDAFHIFKKIHRSYEELIQTKRENKEVLSKIVKEFPCTFQKSASL